MKRAAFSSFISFGLVLLFAFFIGIGIKQGSAVEKNYASGVNSRENFALYNWSQTVADVSDNAEIEENSAAQNFSEPPVSESETENCEINNFAGKVDDRGEDKSASVAQPEISDVQTAGNEKAESSAGINAASLSTETVVNASFGMTYKNRLETASSVVSFNLRVTDRGALNYTLSSVSEVVGGWKAELYQEYYVNGTGSTALRSLNVLNATAEGGSSPNIGLMPGNYVIKVTSGSVFSDSYFELKIGFAPSTEYEIEYNDSYTRYTEIYPGVSLKGSASYYLSGQDTDWFMFRNDSDAYFSLTFAHEELSQATVAFKVSIFNSDMTELYSGNSLLSSSIISSGNIGLPEGIYFICVANRVYTGVDYTLSLERRSSYKFETETNDSMSSSDILLPGVPVRGALSSRSGVSDKDYFSITNENSGYIKLELKNIEPASSYKGYVRRISIADPSGNIIYSSLIADNAESLSSPNIGLDAGTYYIIIDDNDLYHSSSDYELSFNFTETNGWEKEFNNTPVYATPILEDIPVSGTISDAETDFDTDYFVITAENSGKMTVYFSHDKGITSREIFRISLYNRDMEQVGNTLVSFDNKESVSADFDVSPGVYYVKVTSGSYSSDMRYYLTCSFQEEI
ncbi:MAG: hypothetical protein J1E34_07940 [Oscillospiraceae bacterium]|nr:hypothetical protein [Oscillospiraceae bacterium]